MSQTFIAFDQHSDSYGYFASVFGNIGLGIIHSPANIIYAPSLVGDWTFRVYMKLISSFAGWFYLAILNIVCFCKIYTKYIARAVISHVKIGISIMVNSGEEKK